jgi:nucleoside-diphosphate-sugar epimerase
MNTKPSVLLTGATGAVGFELLKQLYLARDKYQITIFDLNTAQNCRLLSAYEKEIEIVYGDITVDADVRKICHNKNFIIHLAAVIPPIADEKPELALKVNTQGTENLIRKLEQFSPSAFFIYSSSISVYGDRIKNPMIDVNDPLIPSEGDEYAKTKIRAEAIIRDCKLDWSIFRLTAIMGKHKISKLMFHMPLNTAMEIATPEDTARAFINAFENKEQLSKKTFNLGGGGSCRLAYEEFLKRSFEIFGMGKLDFPPKAFAEKNFHCGYYADGDELEKILHFRKDDLEAYFEKVKKATPKSKKILTMLFRKLVKRSLLKQSEPFHAYKTNDKEMKQRFFN